MKKIKLCVCVLLSMFLLPLGVKAADGNISVTGTSSAVIGNTVTITVTLSSSTPIGSWEIDVSYDDSYLQLISTSNPLGGNAIIGYMDTASGVKKQSYTYKFKALKKGTTKVGIASNTVYSVDEKLMSISLSSKSVRIMTQEELEASYSKDNNLKSLSVEGFELSPEFSKDVTEYSVTVPEDTKQITINATENDSAASVSGAGTFDVTQGTNNFQIVVRAENGSEKTYNLTVEVIDANPINVTIKENAYTVVKVKEFLPTVNAYQETTVKINDFDIPAYTSEITGFTLVGLKDSEGNISLFIYDADTNTYTPYTELQFNQLTIYVKETSEVLDGYEYGTIAINDIEVPAYYTSASSRFAIIYGINVETGEEGFFKYDKTDQSIQKYDDEMINDLLEKNKVYSYIIIGFSAILVVMFIVLIATLRKGRRKKNKNINVTEVKILDDDKKKKTIEEDDKQDSENNTKELNVIEEVNNDDFKLDEEMYDKVDNKKKKKKSKGKKK